MAKKILCVEDSPATQKFISFTLKYRGYDVVTADDGVEGMEKISNDKFDLIILDIMMPRMTGLEVLKEVKGNPEFADTPVIMLTSEKSESDRDTALNLGAKYFLNKPFQPPELLDVVSKVLG